jgi:NADH-ubiquinone oxidoreductase chain 6
MSTIFLRSIIFIILTHPISIGLILLIQTITISLTTGIFTYNFWYSYILFLIIIGGILVLFIYITSVASNEKFKMTIKTAIITLTSSIIIILTIAILNNKFINLNNFYTETIIIQPNFKLSLIKFINFPSNIIIYIIIIYLLITLIAVVKISTIKEGPLRQIN